MSLKISGERHAKCDKIEKSRQFRKSKIACLRPNGVRCRSQQDFVRWQRVELAAVMR
jgi:hypothetical protein